MNFIKSILGYATLTTLVGLAGLPAGAQLSLPADFPTLVIVSNGPVAPGDFLGTLGAKGNATNNFNVVLDNSATPLYDIPFTNLWRAVTPSGLIAESAPNGWRLHDETFAVKQTFPSGDGHDFKLLPNGHALILENENWPVDMSRYFPGGRPDAVLSSMMLTEVDANNNVVFQWRARNHLAITDSLDFNTLASVDWTHVNALTIDPLDNNYLVSLRGFCQILKISRTNGAVLWRLGGVSNQFTFVNEHPDNAPYYFIGQHNVHRLANGDIIFFDNGSLQNQGSLPGRTYSRAVEYHLDETNMIATLVWEYRHIPDVLTPSEGIVKRFTNGDTYVGWVSAAQNGTGPVFTEVNASNQVMFEVSLPGFKSQTILNKQVWNSPALVQSDTNLAVIAGQTYNGANSGVAVTVNSLGGPANNQLIVSYHDDAVRYPFFPGKEPQVLVPRVTLAGTNISTLSATLVLPLPANNFCYDTPLYPDPSQLTIYQRPVISQGVFAPLATVYDPVAGTLTATTTNLGEFICTYPDLPEIPIPPILLAPASPTVNQSEPVTLQWTPQGFAHSYHLQVATDAGFNNLVADQPALTNLTDNLTYTLPSVQAGSNYFWRVNVGNYGGTSTWATASFAAVPPMMQVTSPAGGEAWQRGLPYFIRWTNNLAENVTIKLLKGGSPFATIASNVANLGAYYWSINYTNLPADNYTVEILSATNSAVFGLSPQPFSIVDPPGFIPGSVSVLTNGTVKFGLTAPGAATATVWVSTNLTSWQVLQQGPVTNGAAVFTDPAATNPARFYQLSVP